MNLPLGILLVWYLQRPGAEIKSRMNGERGELVLVSDRTRRVVAVALGMDGTWGNAVCVRRKNQKCLKAEPVLPVEVPVMLVRVPGQPLVCGFVLGMDVEAEQGPLHSSRAAPLGLCAISCTLGGAHVCVTAAECPRLGQCHCTEQTPRARAFQAVSHLKPFALKL